MQKITMDKYKEVITSLLIDNREQDRVKYALEQYEPLNPVVCQLDYGDYIFIGENGVKVVFEYKTGGDWLNSINSEDNHLHNQVYDMITHEDYTFIIVECEDMISELDQLYYSSGVSMSLQQINGAISTFCTVSTIINVQTQYQAFDLMPRIASKIIQNKPYGYKYGRKTTNTALNYLKAIKGLNNKAETICRQLDLHTLNDLLNLTVEDLCQVDKIGSVTAEKIISQIK